MVKPRSVRKFRALLKLFYHLNFRSLFWIGFVLIVLHYNNYYCYLLSFQRMREFGRKLEIQVYQLHMPDAWNMLKPLNVRKFWALLKSIYVRERRHLLTLLEYQILRPY